MNSSEDVLGRRLGKSLRWSERNDGILEGSDPNLFKDSETGSILEFRDGSRILHAVGSPFERGLSHGRLLKDTIEKTRVADFYGDFLYDSFIRSDALTFLPDEIRGRLANTLERFYYDPLEKRLPQNIVEEMEGIAEGSGISREKAIRSILSPDIMEHLAGGFLDWGQESLGNYFLGACSAFYVKGDAVKNGHSMLSRNMDFPGGLVWKPLLIFNHPEEIDNRYMYVTGVGFPGYGLTGFSEKGIAMSTHVCVSKNYSKKGMPSLAYNHEIFTKSDSLDDVIRSSSKLRCASPHSVVFGDAERAISLEVDSENAIARNCDRDEDILLQTNHFLNPKMVRDEVEYPLEREHTLSRYRFLANALQSHYGKLDEQKAIDIISSNYDPNLNQIMPLGDTPAQMNTLSSVLMKPGTGDIWVASSQPPAVCYGDYRRFNIHEEFSGAKRKNSIEKISNSGRPIFKDAPRRSRHAQKEMHDNIKRSLVRIEFAQNRMNKGKDRQALNMIHQAQKIYDSPPYDYLEALLHMKNGDFGTSLDIMEKTREDYSFGPAKDSALDIWIARCNDLLGNRDEAESIYLPMVSDPSVPKYFRRIAQKGLRRPYRPKDIPKTIDFGFLGPLEF